MTLDPFRTFCRLLLVEKAGGGEPAWEGGGEEGGPAFRQIYAMKKILQKCIVYCGRK